ncbi:MAG TPA: GNAT family N-acetyltransferase [Dissulfurispiraceae bacterium]|nr:GNAT family N-acetyltransferase [Dissulfurispiraceae bacterium]
MGISYKNTKDFAAGQLQELFLSVKWESAKYPRKLLAALRQSDMVYSAWDGQRLVGLINSLSDGVLNVYFPYLLVMPEYQGAGIGKRLVELILQQYKCCTRKSVIAFDEQVSFYERCGFKIGSGSSPMFITEKTKRG